MSSGFYHSTTFLNYVKKAADLLQRWKKEQKKYLVYGAGVHTQELLAHIPFDDTLFLGFIDQSATKQKEGFSGYPVYSLTQAADKGVDGIIISSFEYQEQIKKHLLSSPLHEKEIAALYPSSTHKKEYLYQDSSIQKAQKKGGERKIAVVDTFFSWPPQGGSSADLAGLLNRLVGKGFSVTLFLPVIDDPLYYPRGRIVDFSGIDFSLSSLPFLSKNFKEVDFTRTVEKAISSFDPEFVFLGDIYALKIPLVEALQNYTLIWRCYAYDIICPRINLIDNNRQNCTKSFLANPEDCRECIRTDKTINWDQPIFHQLKSVDFFSEQYHTRLRQALTKIDHFILYNQIIEEKIIEYGVDSSRIHRIPTGIDELHFTAPPALKKRTEKTLFFPGRVEDDCKGFYFFVPVFRRLRKKYPSLRLMITGKILEEEGIESVGWLEPKQLAAFYQSVDIVVIPSLWEEPFGIVAVEAMAHGVPVVASMVGGLKDIIADKKTGFLCPVNDTDSFFTALDRLIADESLRERVGEQGKIQASSYKWEEVMKRYSNIFK